MRTGYIYLAFRALGLLVCLQQNRGILKFWSRECPEVPGWSSCFPGLTVEGEFLHALSAELPFLFLPQSLWHLLREHPAPPAAAGMARQTPALYLHPPLPLPKRSHWLLMDLLTPSLLSLPLPQPSPLPPPHSNLLHSQSTHFQMQIDGRITQMARFAVQRCFFFSYGYLISCNKRSKKREMTQPP